ncbi:TPA: DNA cytosine methyltransferase [Salmonella enterica]|nr:DNA cytosine methyltransferase [Salmonella enterica]
MSTLAYYNEFDPFAAQWLRNLIDAGLIAPGIVDDRSISDVTAADLKGFTQCHFFAGIGGWSLALRLAGVPDNFACWTGSPPCQPFSSAGKQLGQLDERHLAPTFMRLVTQCHPPILFGEQVAAAIGKHWLDDLFDELERENYACGAAVLPAASVGAPHKRDRVYFGAVSMAQPLRPEWSGERLHGLAESYQKKRGGEATEPTGCSNSGCVAHSYCERFQGEWKNRHSERREGSDVRQVGLRDGAGFGSVAYSHDHRQQSGCRDGGCSNASRERDNIGRSGTIGDMGDTSRSGWQQGESQLSGMPERNGEKGKTGRPAKPGNLSHLCNQNNCFWKDADWIGCRDGRFRPIESGTFPLADGIPARVGRLRGYGNAIVPQVAAEFIGAFLDGYGEML